MARSRRVQRIPLSHVSVTSPFWRERQEALVRFDLPHQHSQLIETGRIANLERAAARETGGFQGIYFNDSDVYKWAEATAYALSAQPDAEGAIGLREKLDSLVSVIVAAQMEDGYLNSFFQLMHPTMRWRNLGAMHEMYCGGHLLEAGVALHESLGDDRLLKVAIRFADHVATLFGPNLKPGYCGHEEFELALLRLADHTGVEKYRDLARWMVEIRGHRPSPLAEEFSDKEGQTLSPWMGSLLLVKGEYDGEYAQDHLPIRQHASVVGHAVRAMYLYIAATQLAGDDPELLDAMNQAWKSLTERRMYITGGIGPSARNEGFTKDYDLPNGSAYAETCAACGLILWGQELLELTGNSDYGDIIERALYNGMLAGISMQGGRYFYDNPLESRGQHERTPWFHCACCPPNVARVLASVGRLAIGQTQDGLILHLLLGLTAETKIRGQRVRLVVESDMPVSGHLKVTLETEKPIQMALRLRVPYWAGDFELDAPWDEAADYEDGYVVMDRTWQPGDSFTIDAEMVPRWTEANPLVLDNLGRVVLERGPLVYCAEEKDLGFYPQFLTVDPELEIDETTHSLTPNVKALVVSALRETDSFSDALYDELGTTQFADVEATMIPYALWNHRGKNAMQVWLRKG